jgi:hypothetical protein
VGEDLPEPGTAAHHPSILLSWFLELEVSILSVKIGIPGEGGRSEPVHHRFAPFQEVMSAVSHAFKISQVKLNSFEAAAFGRTFFAHQCSRRFGLFQVSCRANDLRTMCRKRARSLNSESGRNPGDKNPFALQIDPS